jgi:hypothetical protein
MVSQVPWSALGRDTCNIYSLDHLGDFCDGVVVLCALVPREEGCAILGARGDGVGGHGLSVLVGVGVQGETTFYLHRRRPRGRQ